MKPQETAYLTILEMMDEGIAKGHVDEAWRNEPMTMHIQKGARHAMTAQLLIDHPDFCKDPETARVHLKQALCRIAFALTQELSNGAEP